MTLNHKLIPYVHACVCNAYMSEPFSIWHFVNNDFFSIKLLRANVFCACNLKGKDQIGSLKGAVGVDWFVYAIS